MRREGAEIRHRNRHHAGKRAKTDDVDPDQRQIRVSTPRIESKNRRIGKRKILDGTMFLAASRLTGSAKPAASVRAPFTPDDRARRNPSQLTPRQREHLDRWGYPYVMEDFRFHMTLTGRLDTDDARLS